jgi:4-hydroxy-tetrahydrodipicolinate synthase
MDFGRLVTAMATPFRADGTVDVDGIRTLVDHLIATGTTAIVACGTTGESPALSHEEKLLVFEKTLEFAAGRVPVIAGTGGNNTDVSIELSKEAERLGVDGLLLVTPYYNKPTQEGLYRHFRAIAESVSIPVMLYNVPGRTAVNLEPQTVLRLAADVPNITALKEASGNFSQILEIAAKKPDDFLLYSGDDKFTLPMLAVGGYGVVSVASHLVGQEMTEMINAYVTGDVYTAATWSARLLPIFEALFRVTNPSPLKAALKLLGLPAGPVRLPLAEAPQAVIDELKEELKRLGKL